MRARRCCSTATRSSCCRWRSTTARWRREEYALAPESLAIVNVPERFRLETVSRIRPQKNTRLEGLYASSNGFFTQCEAEGFRRITWFIDRPDVMARYTTTIHAGRERYPVLLSNGNLAAAGAEAGARHWAKWDDPFPKPCYLFAMVAAKLEKLEDSFVTRSDARPGSPSMSNRASSTSAASPCAA